MPADVDIEPLPVDGERPAVIDWVKANDAGAIVTDSYDIDTEYQRRLTKTGAALTVILDDTRFRLHANVLVNGNIYAPDLEYEWEWREPEWCLGTDYLLLREPFRTFATEELAFSARVDKVLVTMGGVDRENRTPMIMRALDRFDIQTTVIIGPGFETGDEVRATAADCEAPIDVREDPENLPELFLEANLAVCTLGTTTYELLSTQTPIIGIPDNDTPISSALDSRDAAVILPRTPTEVDVEVAISKVVEDTDLRRKLWQAGAELVTGDGPKNVADAVEASTDR